MKRKLTTRLRITLQSVLCVFLALLLANPAAAAIPSEATLDFYNINGIYYYNPSGIGGSTGMTCIGDNTNYAGAQVWTDAEMEVVLRNQPVYEEASKYAEEKYGIFIPWQAIATIHRRESSLRMNNPSNGQGIYQLYTYTGGGKNENAFKPGPVTEAEFLEQTKIAVEVAMAPKASGLQLDTDAGIKQFFLNYNGSGNGKYLEKAIKMYGADSDKAKAYEGSTYVMNRYDADRDPTHPETMNPDWKGMFKTDGVWNPEATENVFGAFVYYQALAGNSSGICQGGLSVEQIKSFMTDYYTQSCTDWGIYCANSSAGGPMANCVTFVQYFLTRYNNKGLTITATGNGADVVTNLINRNIGIVGVNGTGGPTDTYGTEPRVFAVFGIHKGSHINPATGIPYGHTGMVLGINEEEGKIYIGQAALDASMQYSLTTIEQNLDDYTNKEYMFAYTEGFLDTGRIYADIQGLTGGN